MQELKSKVALAIEYASDRHKRAICFLGDTLEANIKANTKLDQKCRVEFRAYVQVNSRHYDALYSLSKNPMELSFRGKLQLVPVHTIPRSLYGLTAEGWEMYNALKNQGFTSTTIE